MKDIIAIIGAGNMGAAFYKGVGDNMNRTRINMCDRSMDKLKALQVEHPYTDPRIAVDGADTVLLAVKPQSAKELLSAVSPLLGDKLVISIMAGIDLASLQKMTRSESVVRAMPNLPAQMARGLTGWIASAGVTTKQRVLAQELFLAVGQEMELEHESMLDSLTPLSGSGPAYFFLLAELIEARAVKEGFTPKQAALIARETLIGSAEVLDADVRTPAEWRAAVASKGGTTEAALAVFQKNHLDTIFSEAIDAAIARSRALNQ